MKEINLDRVTLRLYLVMLVFHVHHVLEEVAGRFFLIEKFPSPAAYMFGNAMLFAAPVLVLYFLLEGRRWAATLGLIYAAIMTANGLGHIVATIVTGHYVGGFAGAVSGLGLAGVGPPLAARLWEMRRAQVRSPANRGETSPAGESVCV